nr:VOC family protein [Streptomyces xanthii]
MPRRTRHPHRLAGAPRRTGRLRRRRPGDGGRRTHRRGPPARRHPGHRRPRPRTRGRRLRALAGRHPPRLRAHRRPRHLPPRRTAHPDPARSALFHERVFGRALSPAPVRRAAPARLLPHFACADTAAACAEAVRLGGRVRTGPHDSPYGPLAVLRDDQGAVFAVCEPVPGTGDGPGPEPVWESPQQDPERA